MVIDIHCHLWSEDNVAPGFYESQADSLVEEWDVEGDDTPKAELRSRIIASWWDSNGEVLLSRMDEAGIRLTVLFPLDFASVSGEPKMSIEEQNIQLADLQRKHPDRVAYFFTIDPRRKEAAEMCEKAVKEWGAKGLKFHSVVGYYPTDEVVYPLLEIAREAGLPVLFHSGNFQPPFKEECAHPSYIDKAASDFPDVNFIAAHMSFGWWRELVEFGKNRNNLMCDFSAWQMVAKNNYGQFRRIMRRMMDGFGKERVLFGTDGPAIDCMVSRAEWVEHVRNLINPHEEGSSFTQEEIDAILEGSARKVLEL